VKTYESIIYGIGKNVNMESEKNRKYVEEEDNTGCHEDISKNRENGEILIGEMVPKT